MYMYLSKPLYVHRAPFLPCPPPSAGGDVVYEVKILCASEVYQADESVLLFRVPEGSAVASFTRGRGRMM